MIVRNASAIWQGSLKEGAGSLNLGSGAFSGVYSFGSRFEDATGTNPEELVGAALAACYSMALASAVVRENLTPQKVSTDAQVFMDTIDGKRRITRIHLVCTAVVPGLAAEKFMELAQNTKSSCPVSAALSALDITLEARLTV